MTYHEYTLMLPMVNMCVVIIYRGQKFNRWLYVPNGMSQQIDGTMGVSR